MKPAPDSALVSAIGKRYRHLIARIQQLPPAGSRPLTVAGRVSGWISSKAVRAVEGQAGVSVGPEAVHITALPAQRLSMNKVLARLAESLRDAGCLKSWRNELLDVIGEGRKLGCIERAAMRPLGLLTTAVHLNAWTPDGRLWIARRASTKATDPDMWDTLVGGLAVAGESFDASLLRESQEEAGLQPAEMAARDPMRTILRMHRRLPEGYQVENVLVSECVLGPDVRPVNQDGEVSEIRPVSMDELWDFILGGHFTLEAELVVLDGLLRRVSPGATLASLAAPLVPAHQAAGFAIR